MITREQFEFIKKEHGSHASWAVWADEGDTPKSNMGDLSLLDPSINKNLLNEVNPNIIFVALNFSRETVMEDFATLITGLNLVPV